MSPCALICILFLCAVLFTVLFLMKDVDYQQGSAERYREHDMAVEQAYLEGRWQGGEPLFEASAQAREQLCMVRMLPTHHKRADILPRCRHPGSLRVPSCVSAQNSTSSTSAWHVLSGQYKEPA